MSVFNLERYIGACLDSIINQPFDDYEIVLVNNNSIDGSDAICREYAANHQQIRYYELTGELVPAEQSFTAPKKQGGSTSIM
ncbi:glycosyltransferase [Paenibacillus sp. D2_2]|uniref:glycosyltransferase family 2 protein n=1 Tax=Paenibacillus sp. D2_2 TaxID=3073092 RepID=UPI002815184E|nr:glycosyltransferase [Paenibacillus sp. D2_2]WMT40466.1 glycosyltransferase [Paenibacillus sp. D2_2]